jgi:hypothetical protein
LEWRCFNFPVAQNQNRGYNHAGLRNGHHMTRRISAIIFLVITSFAAFVSAASPTTAPAPQSSTSHFWLLHLPGIGGEHNVDRALIHGLHDGGWPGSAEIYDWTENDPGINALQAKQRNMGEAKIVADQLLDEMRQNPGVEITLTSHSGGTGIAIWALEKLPPGKQIQTLVLLASALSPGYDLSLALSHVRGHAYVFYSEHDQVVLGVGTTMFGTIDGVKTQAAGLIGFKQPGDADPKAYAKLVQVGYEKKWIALANIGSHIGCMSRPFSEKVIAPIVLFDQPPNAPATRPAE